MLIYLGELGFRCWRMTLLFSCCLCLWGLRDLGGDGRNGYSNPYKEVSSEIGLLRFCPPKTSNYFQQGFAHIYCSVLLLGFCSLCTTDLALCVTFFFFTLKRLSRADAFIYLLLICILALLCFESG